MIPAVLKWPVLLVHNFSDLVRTSALSMIGIGSQSSLYINRKIPNW